MFGWKITKERSQSFSNAWNMILQYFEFVAFSNVCLLKYLESIDFACIEKLMIKL